MQTIALILFIITYVLMIALSDKRPYVALISAILYVDDAGRHYGHRVPVY